MASDSLVTDTHPLLHYFCDGGRRLSRKAKQAFMDAVVNKTRIIYVPAVALWEISMLIEKGQIGLNMPFSYWLDSLFSTNPMILSQPFDESTALRCHGLTFHSDPFDRAIVATAIQLGAPLITNDSKIHDCNPCPVYWD